MDTVSPGSVGFSADRLNRIGQTMQDYVDRGLVPGVITVVARHGQAAYFHTCGMMDIEAGTPMREDALFRIYSMTKPITSVAVMMLYEAGKLRLTDPLTRFVPAFKTTRVLAGAGFGKIRLVEPEREITIYDLLTHTAGLSYDFMAEPPLDAMYREAGLHDEVFYSHITLEEMVNRAARLPLAFHPGSRWHYSIATDILGYVVQVASGMPFADFLQEKIFQPLGMVDTAFFVPDEKRTRLATLYQLNADGQQVVCDAPEDTRCANSTGNIRGGAGLVSTAGDYWRFVQMLYNGGELEGARLLGRKTVDLMRMNHLRGSQLPMVAMGEVWGGQGFGLGLGVVTDIAGTHRTGSEGEFGWGGAAATAFWIDPQEDLFALLMTQSFMLAAFPLGDDFRALVYQALVD